MNRKLSSDNKQMIWGIYVPTQLKRAQQMMGVFFLFFAFDAIFSPEKKKKARNPRAKHVFLQAILIRWVWEKQPRLKALSRHLASALQLLCACNVPAASTCHYLPRNGQASIHHRASHSPAMYESGLEAE